jgi:hypothetical protein
MKKILLSIYLVFAISTVNFGQGMFLEGGFGMQFTKPDGLNYVVDRYNETRPYLTEEMKQFNNLDGFNYGFLGVFDAFAFEAVYTHRSQTRSAIGIDASNQEVEQRLRAVMNGVGFGCGYGVSEDGYSLLFGTRLNTSLLKIRTKADAVDTVGDKDWDDIHEELHFDLDLNIKLILKYFIIEPYYSFNLFQSINNMQEVNEAINPSTFQDDPTDIPFNSNGFGLKLMFAIGWME